MSDPYVSVLVDKEIDKKKGIQMNSLKVKVNVGMCEVCDNYTPRVYVEEFAQECCEYCYEAYGDCN